MIACAHQINEENRIQRKIVFSQVINDCQASFLVSVRSRQMNMMSRISSFRPVLLTVLLVITFTIVCQWRRRFRVNLAVHQNKCFRLLGTRDIRLYCTLVYWFPNIIHVTSGWWYSQSTVIYTVLLYYCIRVLYCTVLLYSRSC